MYKVTGSDGITYTAPDLATLQRWVDEGRLTPATMVEDLVTDRRTVASEILGLRFSQFVAPPAVAPVSYPRPEVMQSIQPPFLKAALTTAFCCTPFGIVSIVYATQVNSHLARGDVPAALAANNKAHLWANIAIGIYLLMIPLWILLALAGSMSGW